MGLLTYRQKRKHKKKLTIDMEVEALQESINFHMSNRRFRDAILSIKEIWLLKARPWIYSSTMVTYIECLIREGQILDIAPVEKQLLTFYTSVLDMSPRLLMNFAHEAKRCSSRRAVYAALLSYYACVLAQNTVKTQKAIYLTVESAHLIKDVIETLTNDDMNVAEYLLKMMEELKRRIDTVETGDNKKITIKNTSRDSVKDAISRATTTIQETRRKQRYKSTNGDFRSRRSRNYKSISNSSGAPSTRTDKDLQSIHRNDTLENTSSPASHKHENISRSSQPSLRVDVSKPDARSRRSHSRRESNHDSRNDQHSVDILLPDSSLSGIITASDDKPVPYDDVVSTTPTLEIVYDDGQRDTPYISLC